MTYAQGMTLGVIQGLTEFLPVSSTAHLLLVPYLFGWPDQGLAVDAVLHAGTLAALVAYFRSELRAMLGNRAARRLAAVIAVATIPAGLTGLLLEDVVETHLRSPVPVALATGWWAVAMWIADRHARSPRHEPGDPLRRVTWRQGLAVGLAQALALIPGTSRSGVTITAGLLGGLDRATAARFAFLLGIPVTAGAAALETLRLVQAGIPTADLGPLLTALAAALGSGWLAVWGLVTYLRHRSLTPFVVYRIALAIAILAITAGRAGGAAAPNAEESSPRSRPLNMTTIVPTDSTGKTRGEALSASVAPTAQERDLFEQMQVLRPVSPAPAPDVAFRALDGRPARLSELRGQPILLTFFTTW